MLPAFNAGEPPDKRSDLDFDDDGALDVPNVALCQGLGVVRQSQKPFDEAASIPPKQAEIVF